MAIQVQQGLAMPNPYPYVPGRGQPGANAVHDDAVAAVNALAYGVLWGRPVSNPLTTTQNVRLDLQGYTGQHQMNLQLQVNNVYGVDSTVAAVLVESTVHAVAAPPSRSVPQQTEIVRAIKSALMNSLNDYRLRSPRIWTVTGTPSS